MISNATMMMIVMMKRKISKRIAVYHSYGFLFVLSNISKSRRKMSNFSLKPDFHTSIVELSNHHNKCFHKAPKRIFKWFLTSL